MCNSPLSLLATNEGLEQCKGDIIFQYFTRVTPALAVWGFFPGFSELASRILIACLIILLVKNWEVFTVDYQSVSLQTALQIIGFKTIPTSKTPAKLHCPFKLETGNLIAITGLNQSEFITNWIRSSPQAQMKISKQLLDRVKMKVKKTRSNSCNRTSKINLSAIKQITAMLKLFHVRPLVLHNN